MMASVNILCPNGRRQGIKVTPNMTILQVLEEVCAKRGFEPTKHDLKHGRNILDLSSTFRFSGVPNNGKLELVERSIPRSAVSEVSIALALESGERRQKTYGANTTLADLIKGFEQDDEQLLQGPEGKQPVIINIREEIIGREALEQTTLQSIGLISGRVILRLVHRLVSEDVLAQISAKLKKQQKKIAAAAETVKTDQSAASDRTATVGEQNVQHQPEPMKAPANEDLVIKANQQPVEKRHRADIEKQKTVEAEHRVTNQPQMQVSSLPRAPVQPKVEFKFPEATAGQHLYKNELSDVQSAEYLPCDREPLVFSLDEQLAEESSPSVQDPPDEFFEVTKADLQKIIRDLREQASKDENAPLMTSSMKEAMRDSAYSKYQFAVIRFQFPNRLALQAKFRPRETVHSLIKFVQSCLDDPSETFQLYTTPPKKVLSDVSLTLIQAQLLPMAIVYVSFDKTADASLSPQTLSSTQTKSAADLQAKLSLPKPTTPTGTSSAGTSSAGTSSAGMSSAGTSSAGTSSAGSAPNPSRVVPTTKSGQVPKWYKHPGQ